MEERRGIDNFSKGHTQIPHKVWNILPLLDLNARELKVIILIIRLTYGCQRRWAKLKFANLQVVNIAPPHARKIIESLLLKDVIVQNGKTKEYRLNEEYLASEVTKDVNFKLEKLRTLVGRQLDKRTYQISNQDVTKEVTSALPKEEDLGYQNGNAEGLPKREDLDSESSDFAIPKDILNKKINIAIDKGFIASSNSFKRSGKTSKVNPAFFAPNNETEYAALEAYNTIEPDNPNSFPFYIWAVKHGLPASKFFEISSEIKADPNIKNKGAVFTTKVKDYLGGRYA